jgi:hypothetical protein
MNEHQRGQMQMPQHPESEQGVQSLAQMLESIVQSKDELHPTECQDKVLYIVDRTYRPNAGEEVRYLPQWYPLLTPTERLQVFIYIREGWKNAVRSGKIEKGTFLHLKHMLSIGRYSLKHPVH